MLYPHLLRTRDCNKQRKKYEEKKEKKFKKKTDDNEDTRKLTEKKPAPPLSTTFLHNIIHIHNTSKGKFKARDESLHIPMKRMHMTQTTNFYNILYSIYEFGWFLSL